MSKVAELLKGSSIIESSTNDTIRLWEGHREQATLWRSIALLQIPTTLGALIFAMMIWGTRNITLNVPAKPQPGIHVAQDIPNSEFIDYAQEYINLIGTYQPAIARRQFEEARKMIWGKMLDIFDEEMLGSELRAVESTSRTQLFFSDPTKTKVDRENKNSVLVTITGDRLKRISKNDLPTTNITYEITMTTIPKNSFNPYGIVITNVNVFDEDDLREQQQKERKKKKKNKE